MLDTLPEVHPYSFVSLARAVGYVKRDKKAEDDAEHWVRSFLNSTTDWLERRTGRRLAARSYRTATTSTFTLTAGALTGTGGVTTGLLERDEVAHATALPVGTLIASVDSGTQVTLSKEAIATGAATLTVGFGPLVVDGTDEQTSEGHACIFVPESPVQSVSAIKYRDADNALTALDLTGMRIVAEALPGMGKIILPQDSVPTGEQNIEVSCVAGYLPTKAGSIRGFDGWYMLEQLQFRMVKVLWDDYLNARGRIGRFQISTASEFVDDFRWPADIREGIAHFTRLP